MDFLIGKAIWQDYEPFEPWKEWLKIFIAGRWEWFKTFPPLKQTYIIVAGIVGIALFILFVALYFHILLLDWNKIGTLDSRVRNLAIAFVGTISGIGALFGVYLAILRSETNERQTRTEEQRLIAERLNRVTEDLGKKDEKGSPIIAVRLDALYSLEENVKDSNYDYIRIMEMLSDYVRTNSPVASDIGKINVKEPLRKDIQTSLTIIGWNQGLDRVKKERDIEYRLDLSDCDLHGAKLPNTNLSRASFNNSYMDGINLFNAKLRNAQFNESNLTLARIHRANLTSARFYKASLNYANFSQANMTDVSIINSNLTSARLGAVRLNNAQIFSSNLTETRLTNANLQDTNMSFSYAYKGDFLRCRNLIQEQLNQMFCGIGVKIPDRLTRPDHWPADDLTFKEFMKAYEEWQEYEPL